MSDSLTSSSSSPVHGRVPFAHLGGWELIVVGAVWAVLSASALWVVLTQGSGFPYMDDWWILSSLPGSRGTGWGWAFLHHNGHIIPLQRIVTAMVWMWNDGDLRPMLVSSVALLTGASAFVLYALNRLRGATRFEDAIVPLALLGSHAYPDALWAIMWSNILAASLVSVIAIAIVVIVERPAACTASVVFVAVAILAFQGGPGLLYSIGLAPGLAHLWWRAYACRTSRRGFALVSVVASLSALSVASLLAYEFLLMASGGTGGTSRSRALLHLLNMFAHALGELASRHLAMCSVAMLCVIMVNMWFLSRRDNRRNPRAVAAFLGIFPVLVLCAGIAVSRGVDFVDRYVGMVMPIWCALQAAAVVARSQGVLRACSLCAVLALAVSAGESMYKHEVTSRHRHDVDARLISAVASGRPVERIAADLSADFRVYPTGRFAGQLRAVQALGRGVVAKVVDSTDFEWQPIPASPTQSWNCQKEADGWKVSDGACMFFALPAGFGTVDAFRITFECIGAPWGVDVGGGSVSSTDSLARGPAITMRHLWQVDFTGTGGVYVTTFAFDSRTDGFVFLPPQGVTTVLIHSLEAGEQVLRSRPAKSEVAD